MKIQKCFQCNKEINEIYITACNSCNPFFTPSFFIFRGKTVQKKCPQCKKTWIVDSIKKAVSSDSNLNCFECRKQGLDYTLDNLCDKCWLAKSKSCICNFLSESEKFSIKEKEKKCVRCGNIFALKFHCRDCYPLYSQVKIIERHKGKSFFEVIKDNARWIFPVLIISIIIVVFAVWRKKRKN